MTFIICPVHSVDECGEAVPLELGGFNATAATVGACAILRELGSTCYSVRKSAALGFTPASGGPVRHSTGLIALG